MLIPEPEVQRGKGCAGQGGNCMGMDQSSCRQGEGDPVLLSQSTVDGRDASLYPV